MNNMTKMLLERILDVPSVLNVRISPNKRFVIFEQNSYGRLGNFNLVDTLCVSNNNELPIIKLNENLQFVSWAKDSNSIVVSSSENGNERVVLFKIDLNDPCNLIQLTENNPPFFIRGGELSPDKKHLYYGANYDHIKKQSIPETWIYKQNLLTGEVSLLANPKLPAYTYPQMNSQGTFLIYGRKDIHPAGRQFHLIDLQNIVDEEILNFGDTAKVFARWFPDGENILFISEANKNTKRYNRLGKYHVTSKKIEWIIDSAEIYFEHAWVANSGEIIVMRVENGINVPIILSEAVETKPLFERIKGLTPQGRILDGGWIGVHSTSNHPSRLVSFNDKSEHISDLNFLYPNKMELTNKFIAAEKFTWKSFDGTQVFGWLYKAHSNLRRAIIHIHGGPTAHAEDKFNPQLQYFVARGFNVLDVNYRGSTGFGSTFREKIKEDGWGGREQEDIASGAYELIKLGLAEPKHVGVTGLSFGGYSTWCQMVRYSSDVYGAGIPICGMTDLILDYTLTRPDMQPYTSEMMGGSPEQIRNKYIERSPINFVKNIHAPLLIVQGSNDPNVPIDHVMNIKLKLDQFQKPYKLLIFEDEGHIIEKRHNLIRMYLAMADFFDLHL